MSDPYNNGEPNWGQQNYGQQNLAPPGQQNYPQVASPTQGGYAQS